MMIMDIFFQNKLQQITPNYKQAHQVKLLFWCKTFKTQCILLMFTLPISFPTPMSSFR